MAYIIDDTCVNCGICEPECPLEAIREKGNQRVINANVCSDCGVCIDVCPEGSISENLTIYL